MPSSAKQLLNRPEEGQQRGLRCRRRRCPANARRQGGTRRTKRPQAQGPSSSAFLRQVAFIISHAPSDAASHARLVFRVTNRAHPDRPALTDAYIRNIVTGVHCDSARRMPATSDHAGLSHCYTIAEACDIELSLTQEGDLVTFEARVNAEVCNFRALSSALCPGAPGKFLGRGVQ